MKILYITPFVQHPVMKTSFRHYYFLRELAREHDITLLTPAKSPVPAEVLAELRSQVDRLMVFNAVTPPRSRRHRLLRPAYEIGRKARQLWTRRVLLREMKRAFGELVQDGSYDVVVFHGRSVFPVIRGVAKPPVVMDFCDATSTRILGRMRHSPLHRRPIHWLRYAHTRYLERRMVETSPHVAFISCRDREAILGPDSEALVIPNAVDLEYWHRSAPPTGGATLVFHGGMDYRPNVDAALHLIRRVLPRLRERRTDVELLIVGRDPAPELVEAAGRAPDVTVTGSVPDVRPYLERATVYVAPIRFGAGQQNKLLEAMAMEVPAITSSVGEAGLRVGSMKPPVIVEDDVDAFVASVLRLLDDPGKRARLGAAGRSYIADNFGIDSCVGALESLCRDAVEDRVADRRRRAVPALGQPAINMGSG